MYNITMAKLSASDKDSDTQKHKKRSKKFKERDDNGKKRRKKKSSLYCSLHDEKKVTPLGSEKSLRQGIQIKKGLNMEKRITQRSSRNLISCRHKLPTKNTSMKS